MKAGESRYDDEQKRIINIMWRQLIRTAPERFNSYLRKVAQEDFDHVVRNLDVYPDPVMDAVALYLWNSRLCQLMMPIVEYAEVAVRNSIHRALKSVHQSDDWYNNTLYVSGKAIDMLNKSKDDIRKKRGIPVHELYEPPPCEVISHMSFGFWCTTINREVVWDRVRRQEFMPRRPADVHRKQVHTRLSNLQEIRNRAAHTEPIVGPRNLELIYKQSLELIEWFNPRLRQLVGLLDGFDSDFREGPDFWLKKLEAQMFGGDEEGGAPAVLPS